MIRKDKEVNGISVGAVMRRAAVGHPALLAGSDAGTRTHHGAAQGKEGQLNSAGDRSVCKGACP